MAKHSLVFKVTGSNSFAADTGTLSLLSNNKLVMQSVAFSGGLKSPAASAPIPSSTYRIRLDLRQVVAKYPSKGDTSERMHHWYGIEKVDAPEWQWEWGRYRAALNEHDSKMAPAYRGNFLHGKLRPDDYTHGCICERSEKILQHLWTSNPETVPLRVER